ncbi:MAG: hypothetical protein ACTS8R_00715 [Arsenophonus sp. NC-QC1-MAG3]
MLADLSMVPGLTFSYMPLWSKTSIGVFCVPNSVGSWSLGIFAIAFKNQGHTSSLSKPVRYS